MTPRYNMIIAFVGLTFLVVTSDFSLVSVALPSIGRDLAVGPALLSLVVATSTLVYAGFLILGGRLADIYGQGRCCIAGLLLYSVGAVLVALSSDIPLLIGARALQGLGCAVLSPGSFSMLNTALPEGPIRHRGYGVFATVNGAALIVGSVVGGLVTTALGWRFAFLLNVPFAAVAIFIGLRFVPMVRPAVMARRLDLIGAGLVTIGTAALVWGLSAAGRGGTAGLEGLGAIAGGIAVFAIFFVVEGKVGDPLVPPMIFRSRTIVSSTCAMICALAASAGMFMLPNMYMQRVLDFSAATSGLGMLPQALAAMIVGRFITMALARFPVRQNVLMGFAGFGCGLLLFAVLAAVFPGAGYAVNILPPLVVCGFSGLFTVMMLMGAGTLGLSHELQGLASAVAMTGQQIGLALGISLLIGVTGWGEANGIPVATTLAYAFLAASAIAGLGLLIFLLTPHEVAIAKPAE